MNVDPKLLDSSEINKSLKYFLTILASYSDSSGKCWPNQETIAKRMGVSSRSVRTYLRQAIELKLVRVKRRWKKSNIYHLLCLVKTHLSPMRKRASQENNSTTYKNGSKIKTLQKIPKSDWKICFEDSEQVLGKEVTKRNRGWLSLLIKTAGADLFLDSLRWVRSQMLMGEAEGRPIHAPGGLQLWYLRELGINL